ncbi:hypothetical protein MIR68_003853 [Amoeboaphelidium protococcarum]|nr:hypothetical protein MIR68_003853 [Amoeboaphelidium protococcarum]
MAQIVKRNSNFHAGLPKDQQKIFIDARDERPKSVLQTAEMIGETSPVLKSNGIAPANLQYGEQKVLYKVQGLSDTSLVTKHAVSADVVLYQGSSDDNSPHGAHTPPPVHVKDLTRISDDTNSARRSSDVSTIGLLPNMASTASTPDRDTLRKNTQLPPVTDIQATVTANGEQIINGQRYVNDPLMSKQRLESSGYQGLVFTPSPKKIKAFNNTTGLQYTLQWPNRLIKSLFRALIFSKMPDDRAVIGLVENTALVLLVQPNRDLVSFPDAKYLVDVPLFKVNLFDTKTQFRSFKMLFSDEKVLSFVVNGAETKDYRVMMSVLSMYGSFSHHTKIHVASSTFLNIIDEPNENAKLTPEIREVVQKELKPEVAMTTEALHRALLTLNFSPIASAVMDSEGVYHIDPQTGQSWLNYTIAERESVIEEGKNWAAFTHQGLVTMSHKPFVQWLNKARQICKEELRAIGLEHLLSSFFSHTVLHSIDHINFAIYGGPYICSYNIEDYSFKKRFKTETFKEQFITPSSWFMTPNYIKGGRSQFWKRLYKRLYELDPKRARYLNASVMY